MKLSTITNIGTGDIYTREGIVRKPYSECVPLNRGTERSRDILGELGYTLTDITANNTFVRTARKQHHCHGGHNGEGRTICNQPIAKGETYIEYCGETAAFQSGQRYHLACAVQQGLIKEIANA